LGWRNPPPSNPSGTQSFARNANVDAPMTLDLSSDAFKSLSELKAMRDRDHSLKARFDKNIQSARQVANTVMPIRTMASTETLESIINAGGLWSKEAMPRLANALRASGDPDSIKVAANLDAVAAAPLFNPSDKALGLTKVAQLAFGPPMVNSKNANAQGTGYGTITLVARRSVMNRPGVRGNTASVSAYAGGRPGAAADQKAWESNTFDAADFREVFAQRLAMGMGIPWVQNGRFEAFKAPNSGLVSNPEDYVSRGPMFTSETPEIYVPGGAAINDFGHLLIEKGTMHTVASTPVPAVPEKTEPSIDRDNAGTKQTMVADKYVQFESQQTITDFQGNQRAGRLWDANTNAPMTDAQIEATHMAEWWDGPTRNQMVKKSYALKKVNGVWHFITQKAVPAQRANTKQVDAVKYFTQLFRDKNIDITVIETDPNSSVLHQQYAKNSYSSTGNSPYEDIIYGKASGVSI
jgi:hypothetical protein